MQTDGVLCNRWAIVWLTLWATEVEGRNLAKNIILYSELEGCVGVGHIQTWQTQTLGFVRSKRHEPQRQAEVTWSHRKVKVTMGKAGEVIWREAMPMS